MSGAKFYLYYNLHFLELESPIAALKGLGFNIKNKNKKSQSNSKPSSFALSKFYGTPWPCGNLKPYPHIKLCLGRNRMQGAFYASYKSNGLSASLTSIIFRDPSREELF